MPDMGRRNECVALFEATKRTAQTSSTWVLMLRANWAHFRLWRTNAENDRIRVLVLDDELHHRTPVAVGGQRSLRP